MTACYPEELMAFHGTVKLLPWKCIDEAVWNESGHLYHQILFAGEICRSSTLLSCYGNEGANLLMTMARIQWQKTPKLIILIAPVHIYKSDMCAESVMTKNS
jgi:hypothetical protein